MSLYKKEGDRQMTVDHRQQLTNFINGLVAQGKTPEQIKAITDVLFADESVVKYFSGGIAGQNLIDQKLAGIRQLEQQLQQQQTSWNQYLQQANTVLSTAEREKTLALQQAAAADTAIKAIASQYNIPESEVRALYNTEQFQQQQQQQQLNPFQSQFQQRQQPAAPQFSIQQQGQQQQQPQYLTPDEYRTSMTSVVEDLLKKDAINARHFELTGKPWNPTKAVEYIKQQAVLGRTVQIEEAWRITEGIDAIEATKAAEAKAAERAQIEQEIRQKLASETNNIPTDAQPNFGEARLSSIFNNTANTGQDNQGQQQQQEQTGHHARTAAATAAFHKLQESRRLGQPSPYQQPANAVTT